MSNIIVSGGRFFLTNRFRTAVLRCINRSIHSDDDKNKKNEENVEEGATIRKGLLHDKQKSIQEESYFHKEEVEQLKELKKKIGRKEKKESDKKD